MAMHNHLLLLLCLLRLRAQKQKNLRFRSYLSIGGKRRRDRRIPRIALQMPSESAFMFLYRSGSDQALITLLGLDYSAFSCIYESFAALYERYSPYSLEGNIRILFVTERKRGRPRSMTATQCLALVLNRGRKRGSDMVLCQLFGITSSVCSLFLRFGRPLLLKVLSQDAKAMIKMQRQ